MTATTKPRLISLTQRTAPRPYEPAAADTRFAAMVEEHQRQRQMLTPRELEVLALLCEGLPTKLIERRLGIGAGTVKCHVANILSKLGVSSRLQAVIEAYRRGVIGSREDAAMGKGDIMATPEAMGAGSYGSDVRYAASGRG